MARVTVEDCVTKVPNRFELVLMAAQRAKAIGVGAALTVDRDNDKNSVVSLREIEEETIPLEELKENVVKSFQKVTFMDDDDENEEDMVDLMDGENDWSGLSSFGSNENLIGSGMSETDAATEKAKEAAPQPTAADSEFMVGQAIDTSEIPAEFLKED